MSVFRYSIMCFRGLPVHFIHFLCIYTHAIHTTFRKYKSVVDFKFYIHCKFNRNRKIRYTNMGSVSSSPQQIVFRILFKKYDGTTFSTTYFPLYSLYIIICIHNNLDYTYKSMKTLNSRARIFFRWSM